MLRLILQSVEISEQETGERQAIVTLNSGETSFVGSSKQLSTQDDYITVAEATLDAVRQVLSIDGIKLELDKAAPIRHDSINNNLLVVTVDYSKDGKTVQLTGSCLSNDEQATHNIAKATLDATNRIIAHLSESENLNL
ncbi:MAG: hypothetical protein J0M03_18280 [Acidobacteria bacterium]|nr:hypothetical protein [Acidobacteriota bacterium]